MGSKPNDFWEEIVAEFSKTPLRNFRKFRSGAGMGVFGMEPRLTSGFWVSAYLNRLRLAAIPVFVTAKGDETAGAVLVKVATLYGQARAFQRSFDLRTDARVWVVLAEGAERDVDAALARQRARDPDLWVLEIEDKAGRTLLEEEGLSG